MPRTLVTSTALFAIAVAFSVCAERAARADDIYVVVLKKQQEKKKLSQWSLSEWLETRDRMRLMDMWLALHTPSPFEFILGGNYQFADLNGAPFQGGQLHLAGYATIFGLELQAERSSTRILNALFNARVFGYNNQTTNLTFHGGLRLRGDGAELRSPVAGAPLTLYLTRHFGVDGLYRHVFASTSNNQGMSLTARRYEAGAFIDFSFARVYGGYFNETETVSAAAPGEGTLIRKGGHAGLRMFF